MKKESFEGRCVVEPIRGSSICFVKLSQSLFCIPRRELTQKHNLVADVLLSASRWCLWAHANEATQQQPTTWHDARALTMAESNREWRPRSSLRDR